MGDNVETEGKDVNECSDKVTAKIVNDKSKHLKNTLIRKM